MEKVDGTCLKVSFEETTFPSKARGEDKNIGFSPFGVEVVNDASLGGKKTLHEFGISTSNKKLASLMIGGNLTSSL